MGRFNLTKLSSGERFIIDKTLGLNNIRVELTWQNGDLDACTLQIYTPHFYVI